MADQLTVLGTWLVLLLQFGSFAWLFWQDRRTRSWTRLQICGRRLAVTLLVHEANWSNSAGEEQLGEQLGVRLGRLLESLGFVVWRIKFHEGPVAPLRVATVARKLGGPAASSLAGRREDASKGPPRSIWTRPLLARGPQSAADELDAAVQLAARHAQQQGLEMFAYISVVRASQGAPNGRPDGELVGGLVAPSSPSASSGELGATNGQRWTELFVAMGALFAALQRLLAGAPTTEQDSARGPPCRLLIVQDNTNLRADSEEAQDRFLQSLGPNLATLLRQHLACQCESPSSSLVPLVQLVEIRDREGARQPHTAQRSWWRRLAAGLRRSLEWFLFEGDRGELPVKEGDQPSSRDVSGARDERLDRGDHIGDNQTLGEENKLGPEKNPTKNSEKMATQVGEQSTRLERISRTIGEALLLVNPRESRSVIL